MYEEVIMIMIMIILYHNYQGVIMIVLLLNAKILDYYYDYRVERQ